MTEKVISKFSDESYNFYSLFVTFVFFYWAYYAINRFYRAMLLRSAVSSDEAVLIRGISSNINYFESAWPVHAHAILHTRQAEPPKIIKTLIMPYQFNKLKWIEPSFLMFNIQSIVDCFIIVLVDVSVENLRLCFASERVSNRLYQRTKIMLQQLCVKNRKTNHIDKFCLELAQILSKAGICSIASNCQYISNGDSKELKLQVTPNILNQSHQARRSSEGDLELGSMIQDETSNHHRGDHNPLKHIALLIVPNNSTNQFKNDENITTSPIKKAFEHLSFPHPSITRDDSIRNPALLLSRSRSPSRATNESRERVSTISNEDLNIDSNESTTLIDFSLILLSSSHGNKENDNNEFHNNSNNNSNINNNNNNHGGITHTSSSSSSRPSPAPAPIIPTITSSSPSTITTTINSGLLGGHQEELKIEESFIYADSGLHSLHDVYGVPSIYNYSTQRTNVEQKAEENDCVICLTEKKEIFLLPCRHMCVCKGCFIHIDKCPVCRTPFNTYVIIQDSTAHSSTQLSSSLNEREGGGEEIFIG